MTENNDVKVVYLIDYVYFRQNKNADIKMVKLGVFSQNKIYYETTTLGTAALPLCVIT